MTKRGGFTLVELVVVIVAVGILATLGVLGYNQYQTVQREKAEKAASEQQSQQAAQPDTPETTEIPAITNQQTPQGSDIPAITATVNSTTQVTTSWTTGVSADESTGYTLLRATNEAFTAGLSTVRNIKATSYVSSGLVVGQTYFFKVQAVTGGKATEFSNVAKGVTAPTTPTEIVATANAGPEVSLSWAASPGATSYVISYGLSNDSELFTTKVNTNQAVIKNNLTQGVQWFFKVRAAVGVIESSNSASVSATTPINAPAPYSITSTNNGKSLTGDASTAVCPEGTTAYYLWKANNTQWVHGAQYRSATYSLSPGQTVSLQAWARCQKDKIVSEYTQSANSVTYGRLGSSRSAQ